MQLQVKHSCGLCLIRSQLIKLCSVNKPIHVDFRTKVRTESTGRRLKIFNISLYHYRGLIEGIFGAEETEHHQMYCRFRLKNNQKRFGLIKALGWNLVVLNRLQYANKLGINVTQYAIPN